jgi:hypothetical protein
MEAARTIAVREERVLWVGEGAGRRDDARTIVVGRSGDVVAEPDALPFADGEFDRVALRADAEALAGKRGDRCLRELERVTAPAGTYRLLRPRGGRSARCSARSVSRRTSRRTAS